jgi:hypothetical protein
METPIKRKSADRACPVTTGGLASVLADGNRIGLQPFETLHGNSTSDDFLLVLDPGDLYHYFVEN